MVKCMRVPFCHIGRSEGGGAPPGIHGKMRGRSSVLHAGGLGGRSSPQGHSPNDIVNCVCNLPYGGSSGVLWGPGGVREGLGCIGGIQGGDRGVPGRFLRDLVGPLEKCRFLFVGV